MQEMKYTNEFISCLNGSYNQSTAESVHTNEISLSIKMAWKLVILTCAVPESFVRGGQTPTTIFVVVFFS